MWTNKPGQIKTSKQIKITFSRVESTDGVLFLAICKDETEIRKHTQILCFSPLYDEKTWKVS